MSTAKKAIATCILVAFMLLQKTGLVGLFGFLFIWSPCLFATLLVVFASDWIAAKFRFPPVSYIAIFFALYGFSQILASFPNYEGVTP